MMKDEDLYKDRESQINAIEKTFEYASRPVSIPPDHTPTCWLERQNRVGMGLLQCMQQVWVQHEDGWD